MITSRDNPKVKWIRSLADAKVRRKEGCFLVEGVILLEDALAAGIAPRLVLYDGQALSATRRGRQLRDRLAGLPAEETTSAIVQSACDTVSAQGVIAVVPMPAAPDALPAEGLVVVLDGLHDPGNAGAILRSADAAGCAAVIATPETTDLFGPKVVRAAMGAHWHLPIAPAVAWPRLAALLTARAVYLAEAGDGAAPWDIDWTQPCALVIGNETEGTRPDAQRCATGRVSIPMPGRAESLNASVAASIIIFESVRQRLGRTHGIHQPDKGV